MHQYSKSLAGVVGLALLLGVSATHAADLAHRDRYGSMPAPLRAESFTAAVLARNASLRAMRQALIAAVSSIRPAGALPDPMLSVSAAPHTFGSATGTGEDIEVSQALPWWGTLEARKEIARGIGGGASRPRGDGARGLCGPDVRSLRAWHQLRQPVRGNRRWFREA